ncbi:MAG TPA: hypothetical protein VHW46_04480 [Terracidiphilus sp.]|jgi:hypothetical protein|nr:hypothetical protein [Terracidiphilus sp.]
MRRLLSIVLTLFFTLGPVATAFGEADDARLPACCRRHGAHHCAMNDAAADQAAQSSMGATRFLAAPSQCPAYPHGVLAPSSTHALAQASAGSLFFVVENILPVQRRVAPVTRSRRALSVRGPPTALSA